MAATPPRNALIRPTRRLAGRLRVPGDKSCSHRSLMLGGICSGKTEIDNLLDADDVRSTAAAMAQMGVAIDWRDDGRVFVVGRGESGLRQPSEPIDCGNSGTTMRLLSGLVAGQGLSARLVGDESLSRRPMKRIVDPLRQMGFTADTGGEGGRPPVDVDGSGRRCKGVRYRSPVASAQVKSCVLLGGLQATGAVSVREPAPSRDHTERLLTYLGYTVSTTPNYRQPDGKAAEVTMSPAAEGFVPRARPITVPGDISSAAFWLVGAALTASTDLILETVSTNPTRVGITTVLEAAGVALEYSDERLLPGGEPVASIHLRAGAGRPAGFRIGGGLVPRLIDEIPVLAVLATGAAGESVITDAAELRVKESDRLAATVRLLRAAGAEVLEEQDGLRVTGPTSLKAFTFDADGDHRMAMAAAIAALVADGPCEIIGADACAISYAGFFDDMAAICWEDRA